MKQLTMPLVALGALALMAGCPDDETTPVNDVTTDTTTDTTPDNGGETTEDVSEDTTPAVAVCMNASDLAVSMAAAQSAAGDCGLDCYGSADDERQCTIDCMINGTLNDHDPLPLSNDCAGCYGDIVLCSISNCIPACLTPGSAECQQCQQEQGCIAGFYMCTGFEAQCDDGTDDNADGNTDCDDDSCAQDDACTTP